METSVKFEANDGRSAQTLRLTVNRQPMGKDYDYGES